MESVIATLLRDFEQGRLTRRQLVQTIALLATGAPVAAAVAQSVATSPAKPAAASPFKTVWLDHISYQVADYKRSVDFYSDLLGWKVIKDTGTQAMVDVNGIGGIIIRNHRQRQGEAPPAAAPTAPGADSAAAARPSRPPITGVIDHISWGIQPWDNEAVRAALVERGLTPREDTGNKGSMETSPFKSYHVRDPDGWDLQLSNQTKDVHDLT